MDILINSSTREAVFLQNSAQLWLEQQKPMWHLEEYVQMYKRNETKIDTKLKVESLHGSVNSPILHR